MASLFASLPPRLGNHIRAAADAQEPGIRSSRILRENMTSGAFVRQQSAFPRPPAGRPGAPPPLRRARVPVVAARGDRPRRARPARSASPTPTPTATSAAGPSPAGASPTSQRLRVPRARPTSATDPGYDGRVSVPVLWDKEDRRIVSNESADIVRIFNEWAGGDLYPPSCARRSTSSTSGSTASSRTASTAPASRARRRPTTRPSAASSPRSTGSRRILAEPPLPARRRDHRWPTGACSPRCCASTPSTTRTSAATASA